MPTTVQLGAYGQWVLGSVTLRGVVGFSSTRTESARQVAVGDTLWTAEGSFATTDAAMVLEARSDAWSNEQVQLVPVVSLGWYATQRAGFEETGAGGLGLTVDDHNAAWIRGRVGREVAPAPAAAEEKPRPAPLSSAAPLRSTKSPSTRCSPTIWPAGCRGVGRRGRAAGIRDDKQSRRPGAGPLLCCLLLVYDVASHLLPIGYLGRIVAYDPREALGAVPGANHFFQQSDFCERATEALWAEGFGGPSVTRRSGRGCGGKWTGERRSRSLQSRAETPGHRPEPASEASCWAIRGRFRLRERGPASHNS